MSQKLAGRTALITGASRGIGAAVALRFAQEGAHVIATARSVTGLEATDDAIFAATGTRATLVPLDLSDLDAIEVLAANVAQRFGGLDILVGNAGVLTDLTPMSHICPKDWQQTITINLNANWQLLRCFDAMLQQSKAGRAIFVSSGVTKRASPYWGAYAVSKQALETMVQIYAEENKHTNVRANIIDPGATRTRMRAKAYPGEDTDMLKTPDSISAEFVSLAAADFAQTGQVIRIAA